VILFNERHVRQVLHHWVAHYNRGRPHASFGRGLPDPPLNHVAPPASGHEIRHGYRVLRNQSSADFITNIVSSHWPREQISEVRIQFLRSTTAVSLNRTTSNLIWNDPVKSARW
jgi:hypothetical protein